MVYFNGTVVCTFHVLFSLQYEKLWPVLGLNEFGNINYSEFLKKFASNDASPRRLPPPTPLQRSNTSLMPRPESMALRRSVTRVSNS